MTAQWYELKNWLEKEIRALRRKYAMLLNLIGL